MNELLWLVVEILLEEPSEIVSRNPKAERRGNT